MWLLILQRGVLIFEGGDFFLRRVSVVILAQGSCPLQRSLNEDETKQFDPSIFSKRVYTHAGLVGDGSAAPR